VAILKELLVCAAEQEPPTAAGVFAPAGAVGQIGAEAFVGVVIKQNKHIAEMTAISIHGLLDTALEAEAPAGEEKEMKSIANIFLGEEWHQRIEPTNTPDEHLFIIKKLGKEEAAKWFDENLTALFGHINKHAVIPEVENCE